MCLAHYISERNIAAARPRKESEKQTNVYHKVFIKLTEDIDKTVLSKYMKVRTLNSLTDSYDNQGRNHGIDIGGGPNVSPPPDIFFLRLVADQIVKTNRPGHQRMNRGLSMEWEVRELLGLWLQQFIIQPNFRVSC